MGLSPEELVALYWDGLLDVANVLTGRAASLEDTNATLTAKLQLFNQQNTTTHQTMLNVAKVWLV